MGGFASLRSLCGGGQARKADAQAGRPMTDLEHFRAKWAPARRPKMLQTIKLEPFLSGQVDSTWPERAHI
jgi:hypothetical protein